MRRWKDLKKFSGSRFKTTLIIFTLSTRLFRKSKIISTGSQRNGLSVAIRHQISNRCSSCKRHMLQFSGRGKTKASPVHILSRVFHTWNLLPAISGAALYSSGTYGIISMMVYTFHLLILGSSEFEKLLNLELSNL